VFWGNEEMRTRQLAAQGVFRETNGWTAFGYRSRRIVINTNKLSLADAPKSLLELTNETWRGKVALAFPQFGTTATHFHALRQLWGQERWLAWCRALAANKPFIVDGNSVVVKFVARGEAWIGFTDSDDIFAGQREGLPITALPLTEESLLIPNTVAVIRDAPHSANAQKLFDYLQHREVADKLVQANALESADVGRRRGDGSQTESKLETPHVVSHKEASPCALKPDWEGLLRDLETTTKQLNEIFLR
jgi:iron(III) transport system substrate-binding protein